MVLRLGGLPVWVGPSDLIAGARVVMGWTDDAVEIMSAVPQRVSRLLDEAEGLVQRICGVADSVDEVLGTVRAAITRVDDVVGRADELVGRVDPLLAEVHTVVTGAAALVARADGVAEGAGMLVERASGVAEGAAGLVARADSVAGDAATLVGKAGGVADGANALLETYQPIADKVAPLARRFVQEFSEAELQAAIKLVDQLPQLTEHVVSDVLPILVTLDKVGPDVHELLNQLEEIRQAISGIPGFRLLRRRGEEKENGS
jgi:ABC-type transporter Mla subunit MlaD